MEDEPEKAAERILASLPDAVLGKLADLIILKLTEKNGAAMLPKQDVVGSNPITRSTRWRKNLETLAQTGEMNAVEDGLNDLHWMGSPTHYGADNHNSTMVVVKGVQV